MFFSFSQLFQKQLPNFKYVAAQCSLVYNVCVCVCASEKARERVWKKVWWRERKHWREVEVAELIAKWQDNKLLILCLRLEKETETGKSQRGAKSAAQYGTAHQNLLEQRKPLWLMPLLHTAEKDLKFKRKVSMENFSIWVVRHSSVPAAVWRGSNDTNLLRWGLPE